MRWPASFFCVLVALGLASAAQAQTEAEGRTVFREAGCVQCHAYVAKIGAPSAKAMKNTFRGNPGAVIKATAAAPTHATDPSVKAAPRDKMLKISEWLGGVWGKDAIGVVATAPAVPETKAQAKARQETERSKQAAEDKVKQQAVQKARQEAKKAAEEQAKKDAELKSAQKREANEKAKRAAEERAKKGAEEQAALKRDADERSKKAAEAKAKREAELQAQTKRDADEMARKVAEAKANNDREAEARLKREADERARKAAEEKARLEAEERAAKQRDAEALAKREAELKAKREAEEQAALKREAEAAAREAEAKAKREAEAKAKREAELKAKKEAEAAVAAAAKAAPPIATAAPGKVERGGKAPDKFRDEPCPPASGAPIANVDETKAKAIMERIDCTGCHAMVQKKTGPPFKKVFEKVKGNPECVVARLKKNKEHNEEGVTDELKPHEFKIVADYLATRAK